MPGTAPTADFHQEGPRAGSAWEEDPFLRAALARLLPPEVQAALTPELAALARRAAGELRELGAAAEARPPRHLPYDAWGRRIDVLELDPAWRALQAAGAATGLVALPRERPYGIHSRLAQAAAIRIFHPTTALATCPLAMTDGAAAVLHRWGGEAEQEIVARLTSREPATAWTAGQWMTERAGGSDVGRTTTVARPDGAGGDGYRLSGVKWFTSAADSHIALTLARIDGDPPGSRGLSLFRILVRNPAGRLQGIRILRLKDKLGTRALPTAELELRDTPARQIGERARGVAAIAGMLNLTRLWNAACAVGSMGHGLQLARNYAGRREAFGRRLRDHPLHAATLADLAAEYAAALQLVLHGFALAGEVEAGGAAGEEVARRLRLLTPLAKLWTGRLAVAHASELIESIGGVAYVEDSGLPRLLRDAQVLPIWEGTTNVLALDVLKVLERGGGPEELTADLEPRLAGVARVPALTEAAGRVAAALASWRTAWRRAGDAGPELEAGARHLGIGLARCVAATLLLEQAAWELAAGAATPHLPAALRFVRRSIGADPGAGLEDRGGLAEAAALLGHATGSDRPGDAGEFDSETPAP